MKVYREQGEWLEIVERGVDKFHDISRTLGARHATTPFVDVPLATTSGLDVGRMRFRWETLSHSQERETLVDEDERNRVKHFVAWTETVVWSVPVPEGAEIALKSEGGQQDG